MRRRRRLELRDELVGRTAREVRVDARLEGREPEILQPRDLQLGEALVRELGERCAAPERERLAKRSRDAGRRRAARRRDEALEALQVELVRGDLDRVPTPA